LTYNREDFLGSESSQNVNFNFIESFQMPIQIKCIRSMQYHTNVFLLSILFQMDATTGAAVVLTSIFVDSNEAVFFGSSVLVEEEVPFAAVSWA
jgi:hypothetical protein